jgi:hypothetical protein
MIVLTAVLIASVGLNLYDNLHVKPVMQTRMDYMSSEAFQSWLDELESIGDILEIAETKGDALKASNLTRTALRFANVLEWQIEIVRPPDFEEHLYLRISGATSMLRKGLSLIPRHLRAQDNLDVWTLQKIENLSTTIETLVDSVGTVRDGVDPVQQLEEKAVLNQVKNHLLQITTTSAEMWQMYSPFS